MNDEIKRYWTDRLEKESEVSHGKVIELDQYRIRLILNVLKVMMEAFEIKKIGNLLDFGCGHARFIPFINQIIPGSFINYIGVDIINGVIEQNKKSYYLSSHKENPHIKFFKIDDELIFKETKFNNWFDSIFSITVLQHILDEEILMSYIRQFWNLLKFGGHVFITENISSPFFIGRENKKLVSKRVKKLMEKSKKELEEEEESEKEDVDIEYIIFRSCNSYKHLFEQVGFEFVDANIFSLVPDKELHFLALFKKVKKIEVKIEKVEKIKGVEK